MHISNEELDEFIRLYQEEFGEYISRERALEMATRLITLLQIIMRPLPPEVEERLKARVSLTES